MRRTTAGCPMPRRAWSRNGSVTSRPTTSDSIDYALRALAELEAHHTEREYDMLLRASACNLELNFEGALLHYKKLLHLRSMTLYICPSIF